MKVCLIIHGRSHLKSLTESSWSNLAKSKVFELHIQLTEGMGHAEGLAQAASDYELVVSCGGDGTHHEVVNGLMKLPPSKRPTFTPIGGGSGNDFMRIRRPLLASEIYAAFTSGQASNIRVLDIQWKDHQRYALNISTAGIGAEIAQLVNRRKFKIPPAVNYYTAILHWLARYRAPHVNMHIDDSSAALEAKPFLLALGNGKYAGNGLGLCPQADLTHAGFALTNIGNVGVLDFLRYQSTLQRCQEVKDPRVSYQRAEQLTIVVMQGPFSIEADGEYLDTLEAGERISYKKSSDALQLI